MQAIFKREFLSYFRNPTGYVAIALFSFISGVFFIMQVSQGQVEIASEVTSLRSFFIVIVPIVTMGLFSEDRKRGTDVIYYANPITMFDVVMGKFLAAMSLFFIMFINVFIHMIATKILGGKVGVGSWGTVIVFFFLAALFFAIGCLASAITDSQIISAIVCFVFILIIQLISTLSSLLNTAVTTLLTKMNVGSEQASSIGSALENGINWLDPFTKTKDFRYGSFSVAPLIFCISMAIFFLYLTYRLLEKKRWSQS